jgi:hypothetical protein
MVLAGPSWKASVRLVIGRSSVRIRPRAPKPQLRGHIWHCWLRSSNRRSFLWVGPSRRRRTRASLRCVEVRLANPEPVDGPPSSAHSGRNSGGRTIGPTLRAGRAIARNLRKPVCGFAAPMFQHEGLAHSPDLASRSPPDETVDMASPMAKTSQPWSCPSRRRGRLPAAHRRHPTGHGKPAQPGRRRAQPRWVVNLAAALRRHAHDPYPRRGPRGKGSAIRLSTRPPGVVENRLDPEHVAHPDDRVVYLASPWVTLALHMETALARKDQGPQLFAGDGQLRPEAGRGDRPSTSGCRSLRALGQVSPQVAGTAADMRHVRADSKKEISSLAMGSGSSSGAK